MKVGLYTPKIAINETIDSVCEFRTECFIDRGIYSSDIKSDKNEFDSSPNTFLIYVEKDDEILSTVRMIKKKNSFQLPIENYFFKNNEGFYNFKEMLEKRLFDTNLENVSSQLSHLAVSKKYRGFVFRKGFQICFDMFSSLLKVSFDKDIKDYVICSSPHAKRIYEKFGAKSIYEGFFGFNNSLNTLHPVSVMYLTRDDAASSFLRMLKSKHFAIN